MLIYCSKIIHSPQAIFRGQKLIINLCLIKLQWKTWKPWNFDLCIITYIFLKSSIYDYDAIVIFTPILYILLTNNLLALYLHTWRSFRFVYYVYHANLSNFYCSKVIQFIFQRSIKSYLSLSGTALRKIWKPEMCI